MPTYDEIRTTLDRGFSVEALRQVNLACLDAIQKGNTHHPSVLFTVATISDWIANAWDEKAVLSATVRRVEKRLKPHLEALLDSEASDSNAVCTALDNAVREFAATLRESLDS